MLVCTPDRAVQQTITQRKFLPFLEKLLEESVQAEQAGNVGAAEQGYYALVQAAPVYAKAWLRLGTIYQRANPPKTEAALDAYKKAVQQNDASSSLTDEEVWDLAFYVLAFRHERVNLSSSEGATFPPSGVDLISLICE